MKAISVLGTASDVGKSIVTTAICRILANDGKKVTPFKSQNMSNNSAVTPSGGEISRAQFTQAEAAKTVPVVGMNPILMKPQSMTNAQIVLNGIAIGNKEASEYFSDTSLLEMESYKSLNSLKENFEYIVHEGAGSCADINLKNRDFANFKISSYLNSSVLLVADIDKGGVFAQVIGTLNLLTEVERDCL